MFSTKSDGRCRFLLKIILEGPGGVDDLGKVKIELSVVSVCCFCQLPDAFYRPESKFGSIDYLSSNPKNITTKLEGYISKFVGDRFLNSKMSIFAKSRLKSYTHCKYLYFKISKFDNFG